MHLNELTIQYINSMAILSIEDIKSNISKDKNICLSLLDDYFKFLSKFKKRF